MQGEEKNVRNTLIFAFRKVIVNVTSGIHTINISYCTIFFHFFLF